MKNWSFYASIALLSGLSCWMMAANCNTAKSDKKESSDPAVYPAPSQSGAAGRSAQPPSAAPPTDRPKEVGQGAAPDQAQVDSLKAAAERERAKSLRKKPKQ